MKSSTNLSDTPFDALSHLGHRVIVHTNRHRKGKPDHWSVLDARTRRLIGHAPRVILLDAQFKVSSTAHRRFMEGGRRTVFAWVEGSVGLLGPLSGLRRATFDPHLNFTFVDPEAQPITRADFVRFYAASSDYEGTWKLAYANRR